MSVLFIYSYIGFFETRELWEHVKKKSKCICFLAFGVIIIMDYFYSQHELLVELVPLMALQEML